MRLRLLAFELCFCCVFAALVLHAQSRVPDAVYDEIASDFEQGRLAEAEKTLAAALREHPQDARAVGLMGVVLDALKRYNEADKYYARALQLDPRSASLLNNLGNHYLTQGDSARANQAYLQVVALDPGHPNANLHLAQMSVSAKKGHAALSYLDHIPKRDQAAPAVQALRAQALDLAGQRPAAERLLRQLESQSSNDPRAAFAVGMIYADWKLFQDAERALTRALESDPANFDILYNLGLAATRAGHLDRAEEVFGIALTQHPDDVDCLYNLARVHAERGENELAIVPLFEAWRLAPQRPDILVFMARTSEKLGFFADTALAYDQYLKLQPDEDWVRRERGFALARCAKGREGIQDLRWYAQKHPRDALGLYELGIVETMRDREKSIAHLNQAIVLDPNLTAARYARAILLYQMGQVAESLDDLNILLKLEPENVRALDQLGQAYGTLERFQEAADVLSRAAKLAPKDTKVLLHYSRALQRLGRRDDAEKVLAQFKLLSPEENRQHPNSGLFEFLKLPPAEQQAQYMTSLRRVVTSSPNDPALQVRWANALLSEGKTSDALEVFRHVRALTSDAKILADCGRSLLDAGRHPEAQEFLQAAIAADPGNVDARLDLVTALSHSAGFQTALTELEGVPPNRRNGDYFLLRAQILDALGRDGEAAEALNNGFRAATRADLYFEAAFSLIRHKQYSQVLNLLRQGPPTLSDSPELQFVQAVACELLEQHDEAQRVLAQIESRWPEWSQPYLMNGIILESRLESSQALPLLETAIALGARDAIAYYYLASAITHAHPQDTDGAHDAIQQALQLGPDDVYIRSLAGTIAFRRKEYQEALGHLTAALQLWPDMVEAHETLSATYRALGEKEKSIAELKEVLRIKQQNPATSHQAPPLPTDDLLFTVRPAARPPS